MEAQAVEIVKAYVAAYFALTNEFKDAGMAYDGLTHETALRAMELAAQYSLNLD